MSDKRRGQVHHIEIYVSNLERSWVFWKWFLEFLGYTEYQIWPKGFSFKLKDTYLVFVQTQERFLDIPYHRCRTGLNHLAFYASSKEEVDELVRELTKRGFRVLYPELQTHDDGSKSYAVFFEDPDRIKVEFVATAENSF